MTLDYGTIDDYSERGFGFVTRTLGGTTWQEARVFFHIKTVKRKYPEFAKQLDDFDYQGISFWYDSESTHKGDQVSELWLDVADLPETARAKLSKKVERRWKESKETLSAELHSMTQKLLGQKAYTKLRGDHKRRVLQQQEAEEEQRRLAEEKRRKVEAERQRLEEELSRRRAEEQRGQQVTTRLPASPSSPGQTGSQTDWWYQQARAAGAPQADIDADRPIQIETKVVGVTFENRQAVVSQLSMGEQVRLRREPGNPHDRNAIRVERANGQQIGYISRYQAALLARQLDACGGTVPATVTDLTGGYSSFASRGVRIRFTIPESGQSVPPPIRDFDENWDL